MLFKESWSFTRYYVLWEPNDMAEYGRAVFLPEDALRIVPNINKII